MTPDKSFPLSKSHGIINSFIAAPDLNIHSGKYPFKSFEFPLEEIPDEEFHFPKHSVLGMQAEACFEAYLTHSTRYKLLAANLQIYSSGSSKKPNEKKTLGELDYIVKNLETQRTVHIELACKFYLYDDDEEGCEEKKWIGPNRKDCLYDKLEKIKRKQFPLLHKKETVERLKALDIEIPTVQKLCLKAFLFLPKSMDRQVLSKNFKDCMVGFWKRYSELNESNSTARYAVPRKKEWLLPKETIENWQSFSEVKKEIDLQIQNKNSPLVYKKIGDKITCFFVVWW